MPKVSNIVPMGPLYQIRKKATYEAFTLGPDPEFVFVIFACVGLNALKILRAINHRCSVQMSNPQYPIPVAGSPEYVGVSNVLMKKYHMNKTAKYRELKVLLELGFIEEYERKSYNSSRVVRVSENVMRYTDIMNNETLQNRIQGEAIKLRKKYRSQPTPVMPAGADKKDYTLVKTKTGKEWKLHAEI